MATESCPYCESEVSTSDAACWNCRRSLHEDSAEAAPSGPESEPPAEDDGDTDSVATEPLRYSQLLALAERMVAREKSRGMIVMELRERGADNETAQQLANRAIGQQTQKQRAIGFGQMGLGALIFLIGVFITFGSGGATIAYGAIGVGAVTFCLGLVRLVGGTD